jgi:HEAT repeat protein
MSSDRPPEPEVGTFPSEAKPKNGRRLQTGVRTLIVLVACCGVMLWAARYLWESQHPVLAAARGLQSRNPSERMNAIRELVHIGIGDSRVAIPPLVAALEDSEAEVRVGAAEGLRTIGPDAVVSGSAGAALRSAITALFGSLHDPQPAVRSAAATALQYIATTKGSAGVIDFQAVVAALAAMLGDRDDEVRLAALHGLARCGADGSVGPPAPLIAAMKDESARIRAAAVTTLASFPCTLDPWVPLLFQLMERDQPTVRDACGRAIGRYGPPAVSVAAVPALIAALGSRDREVRFFSAMALRSLGYDPGTASAIPALLAILREPIESGPGIRGRPQPSAWDGAQVAAADPAQMAARALGEIAPGTESAGEVITVLSEVVRSGHPSLRGQALEALGDFGPAAEPAIPLIIKTLREVAAIKEPHAFFDGSAAARALGRIAPGTRAVDEVVAVLTQALHAESVWTRLEAVDALSRLGPKAASAIPELRTVQRDPELQLRSAAARALTALGDAR